MQDLARESRNEDGAGETADRISSLVDRYADSPFASPLVAIGLVANLLLWLLVIASPATAVWLVDRLTTGTDSDRSSRGGGGVLAKRWTIWVWSGMAGGLNCLLLFVVYLIRR